MSQTPLQNVQNKSRIQEVKKKLKKNIPLYIIIAPAIIYFIIWHYWPMYGVIIAFKNFSPALGIFDSQWAGFSHFERFFNSFHFWRLLKNTLGLSIYSLVVGIPAPIILALLFNELRSKFFRNVAQTISYAPHFLSVVVSVGILFFFISPNNGIINAVIEAIGGKRIDFLANPDNFWHIMVWSGTWQGIGWGSLIYTAAMAGIPQDQYEAAYIDGASKLRRIWHITLPGIRPTIVILAILAVGGIMGSDFQKILLLQNGLNLEKSEVIATYVYKSGIIEAQYSFSAAVGLFNNVVGCILLIIVNWIAKKVNETSLW
ncbi:ABC transporter permease [Lederbergia galactosidilytica]|uniref:Sugar ABC transporter permease n=1 Tax=Lederbergia galactosidilytica TaxID=217031 RepID=A0A177ZGY8_9BACI|nr:ABC transporter permease subunit [Lederbergia galactosidilytica]KRG15423.1 sugar ABC transporter permease [Virgibacillus soli]OAK67237.1 sugar ABC transporter permease [Lederbergia galactosidilytica]